MGKREQSPTHMLYEQTFWERGLNVAGVDEAGRGALAGPVVAAAVVMRPHVSIPGLRDSKLVRESERERLFDHVHESAFDIRVSVVESVVVDEINILEATMVAMKTAIEAVHVGFAHVLIDGNRYTGGGEFSYSTIIDGDAQVYSIAAASIIAKVTRDRIMKEWATVYPEYGFEKHKGYGTAAHYDNLRKHGRTPIHRDSFLTRLDTESRGT